MPNSIFDPDVQAVLNAGRAGGGALFPSPADWRDVPIYFLLVDRFNNDAAPPKNLPFDAQFSGFQGGSYAGVQSKLQYIKDAGFGAIWLSPVLKNPPFDASAYHGYGIQNFLAAEPRFASTPPNADAELKALVDAAHEIGLYVIFDIVLHHVGNVFAYRMPDGSFQDMVAWQGSRLPVAWRDAAGAPTSPSPPSPSPVDAAVWPSELQRNDLFTQQGQQNSPGGQAAGDFYSLKGISFATPGPGEPLASEILIRAYQYVVAKFDVHGFRIDTFMYLPTDFARVFGNSMREYALSAGKKNFFTFGEIWSDEQTIAQFIGRNTSDVNGVVGIDAALDYPLFDQLPTMAKGLPGVPPVSVAQVFENRKVQEEDVLTSHGEAGKYFVTFLDNHDQSQRFGYTGVAQLTQQIELGLALLYSLPGIPCVYYGTEQGLQGHTTPAFTDASMVREALWGKPGGARAFDQTNPLYVALSALGTLRAATPPLRYGRTYFRPISGDRFHFAPSTDCPGVLALSRILNDQEVVVVANTDRNRSFPGQVIVDANINAANPRYRILFSNAGTAGLTEPVFPIPAGGASITDIGGATSTGPAAALPVSLGAGEVQILGV